MSFSFKSKIYILQSTILNRSDLKAKRSTVNSEELSDRFMNWAVKAMKVCEKMPNTFAARHIANQLCRSSTSCGANYEEARGAESRADFLHKIKIVLKESNESLYWLRFINKCEYVRDKELAEATAEGIELNKIIGQSVLTTKSKTAGLKQISDIRF